MAETFNVRRDSSTNNVPTVGYNEGVDAQDVILFGACKVTETLTADGTGKITLSNFPVSLTGATFTDTSGVRRARNLNDDISIISVGGETAYYAGSVSPSDKTLKVYTNSARTAVISGGSVVVTYYKRVPIKLNENGELIIEGQSTGTQDVNITNASVPVSVQNTSMPITAAANIPVEIKSSDVSLATKDKTSVMLKWEGAVAAGSTANALTVVTGDSTKDFHITDIICYYNGTDATTDPNVYFWFDYLNDSSVSVGTMDLIMKPRIQGMTQISFGSEGFIIPAGKSMRFRTGSSWVLNTVHVLALGWQYTS